MSVKVPEYCKCYNIQDPLILVLTDIASFPDNITDKREEQEIKRRKVANDNTNQPLALPLPEEPEIKRQKVASDNTNQPLAPLLLEEETTFQRELNDAIKNFTSNAIQLYAKKFQAEKKHLETNTYYVNFKQLQVFKENKLGNGGYGTVYLGLYYKTPVAIKELNEKQISPQAKDYFRREAEILAHLKHPNIIPCFGYSLKKDTSFIIMQLMDKE